MMLWITYCFTVRPGLGKTTLSGIIANEMGTHLKVTSGPAIEKPGEMAAILNNLQEGDVLFVDEIHRLNRQVEEVLYPAMEDFAIDIMMGKGAVGQIHPSGSSQVYTGRSHHKGRPFDRHLYGIVLEWCIDLEFYTPAGADARL